LLNIRIFGRRNYSLEDLERCGTICTEMSKKLRAALADRKNVLISGATGTGKTTLLNALADEIPDEERIFVIERHGRNQTEEVARHLVRITVEYSQRRGLIRHALKGSIETPPRSNHPRRFFNQQPCSETLEPALASSLLCSAEMIDGSTDDRAPFRNAIPLSTASGCPARRRERTRMQGR
jgi:energy-coupling factor transporter ATP-binding protein EcfA2